MLLSYFADYQFVAVLNLQTFQKLPNHYIIQLIKIKLIKSNYRLILIFIIQKRNFKIHVPTIAAKI